MPPLQGDKFSRQMAAGGGARGHNPIRPMKIESWEPGMACHWTEQSRFIGIKNVCVRIAAILNLGCGIAYMVYRGIFTIGKITVHWALVAYQIVFLCLEIVSVISIFFRVIELWSVINRNCVDFKRIPNHMLSTNFTPGSRDMVPEEYSNFPSVGVFIPCYNESPELVLETVIGALNIDYPKELFAVYLCDDGRDKKKEEMIEQLRSIHTNVFYVTRPDNSHAKAGNLNYALQMYSCDLIVTLDADFIARPHLLQRMIPYYYVWNDTTKLYEFNVTLAVVQTPQHFRNLSPFDLDALDQRSTFFFDVVLPAKDYHNCSTMIGTTNLLARVPLEEANFYPTYTVTEDSAMSLKFHSLGYRTYYLNESLATGLATTSLWSNLGQRSRWMKGDYQILLNKEGPLRARGLNFIQRMCYVHMSYSRVVSVVHQVYEIALIILLCFGISPLDAVNPLFFLIGLAAYLGSGILLRIAVTAGGTGLDKSDSGSQAFEAIFRFTCVRSMISTIFRGKNIQFKVTDKSDARTSARPVLPPIGTAQGDEEQCTSEFNINDPETGTDSTVSTMVRRETMMNLEESDDEYVQKWYFRLEKEDRGARRAEIRKNLKRVWFNVLSIIVLVFAIVWGVIFPPSILTGSTQSTTADASRQSVLLQLSLAYGFAFMSVIPHAVALILCFIPYTRQWEQTDLQHGRCDQFALDKKTGKLYVPWSAISLLGWAKSLITLASLCALGYFIFTGDITL